MNPVAIIAERWGLHAIVVLKYKLYGDVDVARVLEVRHPRMCDSLCASRN